ncbi:DNA helicase [Tremella mesenterica]|uniref:DNA helicase n=1 Tax=Tremella mesenterica TaxID=5217 RepID=A0A4Q1BPR0_TREME|nr:DNA helicase [Tremella mesenterica]
MTNLTRPLLLPFPPSDSTLTTFFDKHALLLKLERETEEEQTKLLNSNCPPTLLERRGLALGGLGVKGVNTGLGGKTLMQLCRPSAYHTDLKLPTHTFRNGDPVRIETHVSGPTKKMKQKDKDEGSVEGIVYRVTGETVTIAVDGTKEIDLPERLRLLKLANSVTFDRMDKTLERLRKLVLPSQGESPTNAFNMSLINCLLGKQQPTWLDEIPPRLDQETKQEELMFFGEKLNEVQKEAIRFCLKAEQVACIHGPPGTGKTHTLVELIFQLLSRPASPSSSLPPRILVTTPSNLALDNLLLRLHALAQHPPYSSVLPRGSILRIGHPTRVHRDLVSETLDYRAANGEDGSLLRDIGKELDGHLGDLARKKGERGAVKGKERGKKWEEIRELRKEYRQREGKVVTNVVNRAMVVLATCHSAGSRQLANTIFDVCIIDEATQAVEAVCWVPILKSKKVILAGDPQQLRPTIMSKPDKTVKLPTIVPSSEEIATVSTELTKVDIARPTLTPPRTLETTLFDRLERLYGPGIKQVLQVQYRMNANIASFPSSALYEGKLVADQSVASHTLLDLPDVKADEPDAKETLGETVVFFDTAGCEYYEKDEGGDNGLGEGSKMNENEAVVVDKWARRLIASGISPADIGIITPYQAQVSLLSSMLRDDFPEMTIGTVDGLQGQEREVIILSLVRSNSTGEVGFLGEYRRLNVAMTRAKRQLCVVGDSDTVGKGSKYLKSWMTWLEANADVRYAGDEM